MNSVIVVWDIKTMRCETMNKNSDGSKKKEKEEEETRARATREKYRRTR